MPRKPKKPMRRKNGTGSIVKLSGNRRRPYVARKAVTAYNPMGYPIYGEPIGYFEDYDSAYEALISYNKNPYELNIKSLTFEDVYNKWFERKYEKSKKKYSSSSIACTRGAYTKAERLHKMKFKEIRTLHMQEIIDDYTLSHAYMEHIRNLFNQMYKFALEFDIVEKNYAQFATITKEDDDKAGVPFTTDELQLLWNNKNKPWVDAVLIYIYTGWRVNELLQMPAANIDLSEGTMKGGLKTKASKNRIVPIHSKIHDMIASRLTGEIPVLFCENSRKVSETTFRKYFNTALLTSGVTTVHTPHDCRHTMATLLNNSGANPVSVKKLLGHATNDITEKVYTHKDVEELRKAIELIK